MNEILLIVVVYNKKISDLFFIQENILIYNEFIDVLVYDNSIDSQQIPELEGININYIHNKDNVGVSKAYNIGIEKSKALNKKYILLLDQDTSFQLSDLSDYHNLMDKYGEGFIYAPIVYKENKIYSPNFVNNFVGKVQNINSFFYSEIYSIDEKSLINSGLMIPLKVIDSIGGFNDDIKLDFSDFYFIEKYKKFNNKIILLNLMIEHSLSGDEGNNYLKEIHRFMYYCNGAKSLNKFLLWPAFRRMIRLIIKYKSIVPISIFTMYFIGNKKI
jgi:GT2 family glycosyltransferase